MLSLNNSLQFYVFFNNKIFMYTHAFSLLDNLFWFVIFYTFNSELNTIYHLMKISVNKFAATKDFERILKDFCRFDFSSHMKFKIYRCLVSFNIQAYIWYSKKGMKVENWIINSFQFFSCGVCRQRLRWVASVFCAFVGCFFQSFSCYILFLWSLFIVVYRILYSREDSFHQISDTMTTAQREKEKLKIKKLWKPHNDFFYV